VKLELVMGGTSDEATHQNEQDMVSPWPTIRVPILMSFSFWWVASEGVCSYIALQQTTTKLQQTTHYNKLQLQLRRCVLILRTATNYNVLTQYLKHTHTLRHTATVATNCNARINTLSCHTITPNDTVTQQP